MRTMDEVEVGKSESLFEVRNVFALGAPFDVGARRKTFPGAHPAGSRPNSP